MQELSIETTKSDIPGRIEHDDLDRDAVRQRVIGHLLGLGFIRSGDEFNLEGALTKERIRSLYVGVREQNLAKHRAFLSQHMADLLDEFANGKEMEPEALTPKLEVVHAGTRESHLFRLASLLWSVPVSAGYGRRMRFLVKDASNGKLIGIFALGDPVFNLRARDQWIGWSSDDRKQRLAHVMDAYVVGAVPPYSMLIGGKLVALLATCNEVRDAYARKYLERVSVIARRQKRAHLVLLTTSSALGRSSLYNRLRIPDGPSFEKIGETGGYGHFHISGDLFDLLRDFLTKLDHPYASGNRFGMGPNWKLRVIRVALQELGLDSKNILQHGISREVFAAPLALNWRAILEGTEVSPEHANWSAQAIAGYCKTRWLLPRSRNDRRYLAFRPQQIPAMIGWEG